MTGFYVYVVARAKKGTNQDVFRFPIKELPDYDVLKSLQKHTIHPEHLNYRSTLIKTANYINTTPDNVTFPTYPQISTEDFPPEFYTRAIKSKYEKHDIGYFGAKKKTTKKVVKSTKKTIKKGGK